MYCPIILGTSLLSLSHTQNLYLLTFIDLQTPSLELECLANYLAELTLVDYRFLNFLPSVIAASAVFLSKWTLDQSSHPWVCIFPSLIPFIRLVLKSLPDLLISFSFWQNSTLEYYTSYKASDLKQTVVALQDLQLNTNGCPLSSIRVKYRQEKVNEC